MPLQKILEKIYWAAIEAVDPYRAVCEQAREIRKKCLAEGRGRLAVVAFGKAACPMARAVLEHLPDLVPRGIVAIGHNDCLPADGLPGLDLFRGGHPVPDGGSVAAARAAARLAEGIRPDEMALCLISGGGSSLFAYPGEGISLADKRCLVDLLLKAGANIEELNCVRKHISRIKGGRLAAMFYPAPLTSLIISDVIGDRLDIIASGPTVPDDSTYGDAWRVLDKYSLADRTPPSIKKILDRGVRGIIRETPKRGDRIFEGVENRIVASNATALKTAAERARQEGFSPLVRLSPVDGEAREAGRRLAREILGSKEAPPACFVSGGETTVKVHGSGKGGRNMELALAFALEIQGVEGIYLLSAGTDGDDNATGAAGAIVDGSTVPRCLSFGLDPLHFLESNDSYTFFRELGGLFVPGATGTNVMDLQIVLREA